MTSALFSPLELRGLTLANRVVVAPMCQYSADDGAATDWHLMHLGSLAVSGAGLLITEATGVEARGRITPGCLGLYTDAQEEALGRVVAFCRRHGEARLGIQLAHAGRKASAQVPWDGAQPLGPEEGAWDTVAPSALAFAEAWPTPRAMTRADMEAVTAAFVASTERAERLGFDLMEVHGAHGYLLSAFLSPLANARDDAYGGSLENRMRFPLEVIAAVRGAWPEEKPLGVRFSGTDWEEPGWSVEDSVALARTLKAMGCDFAHISSGGNSPRHSPVASASPGYQVPLAEAVKSGSGITTIAVGMITEPRQAEEIVASGQADLVALGRGMLYDPRWAWHAAEELGGEAPYPPQYARSHPATRPAAFEPRRAAG
jgi:NADPH2 dehydrogenase